MHSVLKLLGRSKLAKRSQVEIIEPEIVQVKIRRNYNVFCPFYSIFLSSSFSHFLSSISQLKTFFELEAAFILNKAGKGIFRILFTIIQLLSNEVCSNYISPVVLFNAIFCLSDCSSDAFDFSSSKTG